MEINHDQVNCFVGIDQHRHYSQIVVKDKTGITLDEQKIYHEDKDIMQEYFNRFSPSHTSIALEASGSWYWFYDFLESLNLPVKLAHPLKVKLIAESTIKTDHIDAHALADLLRTNYLPTSYIPNQQVRALRELLRYRTVLVHLRTSLKNRIEAVLAKLGLTKPPQFSHLYTMEGKKWLRELNLAHPYQLEINTYLKLIETFTDYVKETDREIKQTLSKDPRASLLMTIPGIGEFTAYLILAEIGDIKRFASPKKLTSYAGLVPSVQQSGKHIYLGRITKQGDVYLRWGVVEATHIAIRHDDYLRPHYQRLKALKGSSKAITAIARQLLESVYWVLTKQQPYCPGRLKERRKEIIRVKGSPVFNHGS